MKITCPKCKTKIPVNPAAMMGGATSAAKAEAAKLNARKPRRCLQCFQYKGVHETATLRCPTKRVKGVQKFSKTNVFTVLTK